MRPSPGLILSESGGLRLLAGARRHLGRMCHSRLDGGPLRARQDCEVIPFHISSTTPAPDTPPTMPGHSFPQSLGDACTRDSAYSMVEEVEDETESAASRLGTRGYRALPSPACTAAAGNHRARWHGADHYTIPIAMLCDLTEESAGCAVSDERIFRLPPSPSFDNLARSRRRSDTA